MPETTSTFGTCVDCNKEVEINPIGGVCSICGSSSIVKRGAIKELEQTIESRQKLEQAVAIYQKTLEEIRETVNVALNQIKTILNEDKNV